MSGSNYQRIAACLLALMLPAVSAAETGPSGGEAACVADAEAAKGRQDAAAARAGTIPGLGRISGRVEWDNRQVLVLHAGEFSVARQYTPLTREVSFVVSGSGEEPLEVRFGGADGLSITRGDVVIQGYDPERMRAVLGGRAIAAFRERVGNFERRLLAGQPSRVDDAHAYGFLFAGAFVASLAGDGTAVGRARDVVMRRIQGKVRAARFDFKDCVTDYELYLLDLDTTRTRCLEAAEGRYTWYARAADRLGCEVEFMAGAMAGEGQFIGCTALGSILL